MPIDPKLLDILCCPVTKQAVKPLSQGKLSELNNAIETGKVTYFDGSTVDRKIEEALITKNGMTVYRIDDGIPVMLEDQSISTDQLESF